MHVNVTQEAKTVWFSAVNLLDLSNIITNRLQVGKIRIKIFESFYR